MFGGGGGLIVGTLLCIFEGAYKTQLLLRDAACNNILNK